MPVLLPPRNVLLLLKINNDMIKKRDVKIPLFV